MVDVLLFCVDIHYNKYYYNDYNNIERGEII